MNGRIGAANGPTSRTTLSLLVFTTRNSGFSDLQFGALWRVYNGCSDELILNLEPFPSPADAGVCNGSLLVWNTTTWEIVLTIDYPGPGQEFDTVNPLVEVVPDLCIGCKICVKECPWVTIEMIPNPEFGKK